MTDLGSIASETSTLGPSSILASSSLLFSDTARLKTLIRAQSAASVEAAAVSGTPTKRNLSKPSGTSVQVPQQARSINYGSAGDRQNIYDLIAPIFLEGE